MSTILKTFGVALTTFMACASLSSAQDVTPAFTAGTWSPIKNAAPAAARGSILLTDGRIMVLENFSGQTWHFFSPDNTGSYINGTWDSSTTSTSPGAYPESAVLNDGRVYTLGGHNFKTNTDSNAGAIYNPKTNAWSTLNPPTNGSGTGAFATVVLPNGDWMVQNNANKSSAILNPSTMTWDELPGHGKADANSSESYTLLPDGTVLTVDTSDTPNSERWLFPSYHWISAGSTVVYLAFPYLGGYLIGPAILGPNGTVFAAGGCDTNQDAAPDCLSPPHSAIYTPPTTTFGTGSWVAGPDFPTDNQGFPISAAGGPAAILPDGNVLIFTGHGIGSPAYVFEFDGTNFHKVPDIPNAMNDGASNGNFLVLPTGQIWFTDGSFDVEIYTPAGTYKPAWQPTISSVPNPLKHGFTNYKLIGTQLNGVSQGATSAATDYPLVQIKNNKTGHVFYCKTRNFSTRAVATGSTPEFTYFEVPETIETGASELVVVANGIPSNPVNVTVY